MTAAKVAQRTPGPWVAEGRGVNMEIVFAGLPKPALERYAVCFLADGDEGEREANAAFIVRACNAHDDLLAALRQLAGSMDYVLDSLDGEGKDLPARGEVNGSLHAARAAIARAEE